MQIVGVSFDDPDENASWAEDEGFTFELWSDDDKTLALYYGAASSENAVVADRVSKLMEEDGTLILEYVDVSTGTHPDQVLADCQALFGG